MQRATVALLLVTQAILLGWQSCLYSPTVDEPAHLVSGLSHWKYGHFDLYRVNPPLIRLIASLPVLVANPQSDWSRYSDEKYARPEFSLGTAFADANGFNTFGYVTLARWACIPICLIGGYYCYLWARDMYGPVAGVTALTLWCFCPNILGNGALITPDAGAAAFGIVAGYYFWHWLHENKWRLAILAGLAMGLTELSKSTWVILFGLWPLIWLIWRTAPGLPIFLSWPLYLKRSDIPSPFRVIGLQASVGQLATILLLALYMLNLGYGFENSFQRLSNFRFISEILGGADAHSAPGNRFAETWFGELPVPVPENYLIGIDVQRYDFERGKWSYLRGEVKHKGGWWYYYLYAMVVKIPSGTLFLCGLLIMLRSVGFWPRSKAASAKLGQATHAVGADLPTSCLWLDELVLLLPALSILTVVSSQTGFARGLRYVLPAFPFLFVWISQIGQIAWSSIWIQRRRSYCDIGVAVLTATALAASVTSSLSVFPHCLSYFNEIVGGPLNGSRHLLDANIDWDQDLLYLKRWYDDHPVARPFYLTRYGFIDPKIAGIDSLPVPREPFGQPMRTEVQSSIATADGWFAISVNELYGERSHQYAWLSRMKVVATCGYSIRIYHGRNE